MQRKRSRAWSAELSAHRQCPNSTWEIEFWFHDDSCKWKHCSNNAARSRMFPVSWNVAWRHNWGSRTAIYWCCEGTRPDKLGSNENQQAGLKSHRVWRAAAPLYLLSKHTLIAKHERDYGATIEGDAAASCAIWFVSLCVAFCVSDEKHFPFFKSTYLDRLYCVVAVWLGSNDTNALLLSCTLGYIATLIPNSVKHEWQ